MCNRLIVIFLYYIHNIPIERLALPHTYAFLWLPAKLTLAITKAMMNIKIGGERLFPLYSDERVTTFKNKLAQQGQRVTPQRLAVYRYLIETDTHPTAEAVHKALLPNYPSMSPATVYKTLDLLVEMGLVTELGFGDSPNRYDGNPNQHVNLVCTTCGEIFDIEEDMLVDLRNKIAEKSSFKVKAQRHEFHGLCQTCQ